MSLPPGLWALPVDIEPAIREALEDIVQILDAFSDRLEEVMGVAEEAYGLAEKGPDWLEVHDIADRADGLEEKVEELSDEVDALKGEVRERAS